MDAYPHEFWQPPLAIGLTIYGGTRLAGGYAGAIAFASIALAIRGRGRDGAGAVFPMRACLCAPYGSSSDR